MSFEVLSTYAAIAEILGLLTIIGGAFFGMVQMSEFKRKRQYQAAADLCKGFSEPELARAITMVRSLPDQISLKELQEIGEEMETSAQIIGMYFETMGLLVQKDIASFQIVQELAGGLMLMMWRKLETWVYETRVEQKNPRFGEWVEWLTDRIRELEGDVEPAFVKYKV